MLLPQKMAKGTSVDAKDPKPSKISPALHPHPPYYQMVCEAITSLKDRTGSSQPAIGKFAEEKYGESLPPNFRKLLSVQLKNCVKSGKLVKVKNSYKIASAKKDDDSKARTKAPPSLTPKKVAARAGKTKRLSQVKAAPEANNKKHKTGTGKMKRLSQVKTPDALKKKKAPTPSKKRKDLPKASAPAAKKARE